MTVRELIQGLLKLEDLDRDIKIFTSNNGYGFYSDITRIDSMTGNPYTNGLDRGTKAYELKYDREL